MENLLNKISNLFDTQIIFKYSKITFDKNNNKLSILFLYPEYVSDINEDQKSMIHDCISSYLELKNCKIDCKFKKSLLDTDLINSDILHFLKTNYQSVSANITKENISISKIGIIIDVCITANNDSIKFFSENNICPILIDELNKKYIAEFNIKLVVDNQYENDLIDLNKIILPTSSGQKKVERYEVSEPYKLFGSEIIPMPEYIKPINKEKQSVILSGKVRYITKKEYVKKKNKDLGENAPKNKWYTFELVDESGIINCTYFATSSTEKKMDKIVDDTRLLCLGDVRLFNNKLSFYPKSISFCECVLTKKVVKNTQKEQYTNKKYNLIYPKAFKEKSQASLFDKSPEYSDFIMNNQFVVYDFETTGLDANSCDIIEIGACKIRDGKIVSTFQTLIKNKKPLDDKIIEVTNITDEMLKNAPDMEVCLHDFNVYCQNCIMVGYNNISFDDKFLQRIAKEYNLNFKNSQLDALIIARSKFHLKNYKLKTVVDNLGITLENAHRALNDALATAKVYLKLNVK